MKIHVQITYDHPETEAARVLAIAKTGRHVVISSRDVLEALHELVKAEIASGQLEDCEYFRLDWRVTDGQRVETVYNSERMGVALDIVDPR